MESTVDITARRELVRVVGARYGGATTAEKTRILDEFVAITGYHRKHAIRLLKGRAELGPRSRRGRLPLYDEAVSEALVVLWESSDRICGKRLKALLPSLLPALERHGHLRLDEVVRKKVLSASAATIDRLLMQTRETVRGVTRPAVRAKPKVQRSVPIRTFGDWNDPGPGFVEADLVAHCGGTMAGSHVHTLVLTDICSGWTECAGLVVREGSLVVQAIEGLRTSMPFPLLGIDTDNGSEFMNDALLSYCKENSIVFTRSRPYRKNDQAWVEQKNGSVVRRLVGYGRFEGLAVAHALSRLYSASRLFVNFFQPSFKLAEKKRDGSRVVKRYHAPETPCSRLLESREISLDIKERLRGVAATLDPLRLLDDIRAVQRHLADLGTGGEAGLLPAREPDLEKFLTSLSTAWRQGEVRPTHQTRPRVRRYWRTRNDPFDAVWPRLRAWFDAEPDRTGKELFQRLQAEYPNQFPDSQLRTLQRRIKEWRTEAARRLVFATDKHDDVSVSIDKAPASYDRRSVEAEIAR